MDSLVATNLQVCTESLTSHGAHMYFAVFSRGAAWNKAFHDQFDTRLTELAHNSLASRSFGIPKILYPIHFSDRLRMRPGHDK
jgi:hypothetical protein